MKLYQGESVTGILTIDSLEDSENLESLDNYDIRAVLVWDKGYARDCNHFNRNRGNGLIVKTWNNIPVVDGNGIFEITTSDTEHIEPGRYLIEFALRDKVTGNDLKQQVSIIEIIPSFTV